MRIELSDSPPPCGEGLGVGEACSAPDASPAAPQTASYTRSAGAIFTKASGVRLSAVLIARSQSKLPSRATAAASAIAVLASPLISLARTSTSAKSPDPNAIASSMERSSRAVSPPSAESTTMAQRRWGTLPPSPALPGKGGGRPRDVPLISSYAGRRDRPPRRNARGCNCPGRPRKAIFPAATNRRRT